MDERKVLGDSEDLGLDMRGARLRYPGRKYASQRLFPKAPKKGSLAEKFFQSLNR